MRRPVARAAGVHDAPARVAALQAEREGAVAVGVEAARRAPRGRAPGAGDSSHSTRTALGPRGVAARRRACPASAARASRRRPAPRRSRPGPSSSPSAASGERVTSATRAPSRGGGQGGVEAGGAGADHRDVDRSGSRGSHRAVPYRRACPSTSAIRRRWSTTPAPATPSGADRIRAIEAELQRRDWLGCERREAPRGHDRAAAAPCTRPSYVDAVRETCARRRRLRPRHARPRPAPGRRRCTPPAAPARWSRRCSAGERGRLLGAAPARPPRRACARDGVLPVRERRDRRPPRAGLARAPSGCSCSTGTCTTATAPTRSSTTRREVLFASLHQYPFYPGTGPLSDVGAGRRRGLLAQPAGAGGLGRGRVLRLVEHVVLPAARAVRPGAGARVGRLRRPSRRPARRLPARDLLVRGSWRARSAALGQAGRLRARGRLRPRRAGRRRSRRRWRRSPPAEPRRLVPRGRAGRAGAAVVGRYWEL